ncbi:MAG: aspartate dehydrogenase [Lachnospiraceae bacterium]|nr:aspartate dehydrogenase [Lachnospiraceae bacterium]
MLWKRKGNQNNRIEFDKKNQKAVLRCSICNGEQVAGFKDIRTGKFQEVMVIRSGRDLDDFRQMYGLEDVPKEY